MSVRFGEDGAQKSYPDLARLTPLPSADNPFFVFLGVKADQKTAVFLVSSDAVATGDGTCKPSASVCQEIELKKGDVEFFDLGSGTAGVVQYELELTGIAKVKAATAASAARARARESAAGRDFLRQLAVQDPAALAGWDYSRSLGVLVAKDPAVHVDAANLPSSVAKAAAGPAAEQTTSTVPTVPASPQP
ncbi:hypothetical protein FSW04_18560 [Baekduia soli]|uniref:Uncharacterized protein n=1 Tax=Baekduia soli TaxID=496014 RepID=A0A5B8U8H8_9ACTN|nr:hypothetical protein [Baekduia soli]QEC49374.1 hypothetical protein FSW04_18560 [Baekduia soli]